MTTPAPTPAWERLRGVAKGIASHDKCLDFSCEFFSPLRESLAAVEAEKVPGVERVLLASGMEVPEWASRIPGTVRSASKVTPYNLAPGVWDVYAERPRPVPPPESDLPKRLRASADAIAMVTPPGPVSKAETVLNEAATEIERLTRELREAKR